MRILDRHDIARALPWGALIAALRAMFAAGCEAPLRHRHDLPEGGVLLLMPAWNARFLGVKTVQFSPANAAAGLPAVRATYLLSDRASGEPLALLDGGELTDRRTAAASVLAASFCARPDSRRLKILGSGRIAAALAPCYASAFPLERIGVWSRTPAHAERLAARLRDAGLPATTDPTPDPGGYDIVSAATLASEPLIAGARVSPGTHLDLIGGFTPTMREADAEAVARASVFVDTREGALAEGGDLLLAIREGRFAPERIAASLADLCRCAHPGRRRAEEITLFKSVGWAGEDLAAAILAAFGEPVAA
ncbi:MAG: ornithine cyclodeaminase family protein [Acetobacteraceae bacterium]|nr:ornithine cyclodeaminase family protein [Acetobacteraceae bacterium]MDW8398206.1 ornithine cyclodeaminase family protein [Acetobacteraceae bacterium]